MYDVEERIIKLAEKSFGKSELSRETEFHAAEIYHRKKHFKEWKDFDKRLEILSEFMNILSLGEVLLIDIQINCEKLPSHHQPEEIAFMFFCERANDLVCARKSLGMLIGDRESDRVSEQYAKSLSGYRADGTDLMFGRDIQNLVDSVHFTHSHLSRFLQLADVYTWLLQFRNRNRNSDNHRHQAVLDTMKQRTINLFPAKYKIWPN